MNRTRKCFTLASALGAALFLGASPAFAAPPVTNGLKLHLDASAITGLSNGDPVATWSDLSGEGNHATNALASDRPTYIASGLNSLPVVRFAQDNEDNGDRLYLGDLSSQFPTAATLFIVATIDNDGRYNLFGNRNNNDERWVANTWNESVPGSFRSSRVNIGNASVFPHTGSHVFALESGSSEYKFNINGNSIGTAGGSYSSGAGANWTIGNRSTSGQQLRGDIAEIILYNRTLTAGEANQVGSYLALKYGLPTSYGPPAVLTYFPANNTSLPPDEDLKMTFNRPVVKGTGNLTIKNLTDSVDTVINIASDEITIVGAVVTINPDDDLLLGKTYAVQMDAGAITDGTTPYPGIADNTTWAFTTATAAPTTTTLTSTGSTTVYGDNVTFTATISPVPSGGSVYFFNGASYLGGPIAVNTVTGQATLTTSQLGVAGPNEVTAEYDGNPQFQPSNSAQLPHTVTKAPLTIQADNKFRMVNTSNPSFTFKTIGLKNGQNFNNSGITGAPVISTTAVLASPVGEYPITCEIGDLESENYEFVSFVPGTLTIADPANTFSVNFYFFGGIPSSHESNLLMAAGLPAGYNDWLTDGWANVIVPWGGGVQPTQSITSNKGSTANFTFQDCRNGWASWGEPRSNNLGIGNYNMMASGVNATLHVDAPAVAGDNNFKMQMTNIPFATYEAIIYFRSNGAQYGDGKGVIKINGGADRDYTIQSGAFNGNFVEMVDATTPGNYIVITGLTSSTFSIESWGTGPNGFNHNGPAGIQLRESVAAPNGYSNWIANPLFGIAAEKQGFTLDADGDGIPNGVEAWFGTHPGENSAGITPVGKSGSVFSFTHPEASPAISDVTGSYQWSTDLQNWYPAGTQGTTTVAITATPNTPTSGTTTVQADTAGSSVAPEKLFLRGVATQN